MKDYQIAILNVIAKLPRWLDPYWYAYLFAKADTPGWAYTGKLRDSLNRYRCRFKGHPDGQVFYNPGGLSPDERCKGCGDYI